MTIDPKDLRRLVIRVVAVTIALRALHLFSVDLGATEVAAAWALPADGHSVPVLHRLVSLWRQLAGGYAALVRAPTLVADVALPLVVVAYARASGWGTIAGLLGGLIVAVAPFGLDEGWRADGSAWLGLLALSALWQLRVALRAEVWSSSPDATPEGSLPLQRELRALIFSVALFGCGVLLSPMLLVALPAGLVLALVASPTSRLGLLATAGWSLAAAAGLAGGVVLTGGFAPGLDQASAWLAQSSSNGGLPSLSGPLSSAWQALAALSPGGPTGGVATLAEAPAAPLWRGLAGAVLWPMAAIGWWRGRVRDDSSPDATWRDDVPRKLGLRDVLPALLPVAGAAMWAAWASARGDPAGVMAALGVARPFAALLLGLGVTAFALTPFAGETIAPGKRAVPILVGVALLQFALGAHHTYVGVQDPTRMAPTKVARFVAGNVSRGGEVLALGLGGLQVAWRLGPWPDLKRVHRAPGVVALGQDADAAVNALLAPIHAAKATRVAVVGDRWVLEPAADGQADPIGQGLHRRLTRGGFAIVEDGHRVLERLSVRIYARADVPATTAPSVIQPQLYPGKAP